MSWVYIAQIIKFIHIHIQMALQFSRGGGGVLTFAQMSHTEW